MDEPVRVEAEPTPNPNAYKLTVNRRVGDGRGATFEVEAAAIAPPLARRLLQIAGVRRVFLLGDFVSITRTPEADWDSILGPAEAAVCAHFTAAEQA
jgi:hypothetical protein